MDTAQNHNEQPLNMVSNPEPAETALNPISPTDKQKVLDIITQNPEISSQGIWALGFKSDIDRSQAVIEIDEIALILLTDGQIVSEKITIGNLPVTYWSPVKKNSKPITARPAEYSAEEITESVMEAMQSTVIPDSETIFPPSGKWSVSQIVTVINHENDAIDIKIEKYNGKICLDIAPMLEFNEPSEAAEFLTALNHAFEQVA
jgi:hypothetical protein